MQVRVHDLIQQLETKDIHLVAGGKGIHNKVSLVHIVENLEIARFLQGNEVVLINGIALGEELSLLELVQCIHSKSVSALVICLGPYVPVMEQAVIDFAEANDLPLFCGNWKVYCADLISDISRELIAAEARHSNVEASIKTALLNSANRAFYEERLVEKGWNVEGSYCVALIQTEELTGLPFEVLYDNIRHLIDARLYGCDIPHTVLKVKGQLVVIYNESTQEALSELSDTIQTLLPADGTIRMTLGKRVKGIHQLHLSYGVAQKMQPMAENILTYDNPNGKDYVDYEQLNLYKILLAIEDPAVLTSYYEQTLAPVVQYDLVRGSNLYTTLKTYMRYNGSVIRVAEELYAHRNTINKQLNKIETILNVDLSDWQVRNKIMLAFLSEDFM